VPENTPAPLDPDEVYDAFARAQLFFDAGRPADAALMLDQVVTAAPESTAALELWARALYASAQLGRAQRALEELVTRRPDDGWARLALGRTLQRQGRADEGARHLRVAAALGQDL
jgi:predicted Zn-dependent protease